MNIKVEFSVSLSGTRSLLLQNKRTVRAHSHQAKVGAKAKTDKRINNKHQRKFSLLPPLSLGVNDSLTLHCAL